jgi:transcriptional regulator with XRE-family HTH domain
MFDPAKLAKLLKCLRKKHKLRLNQLAKLSGLSRRTLSLLLFRIRTW